MGSTKWIIEFRFPEGDYPVYAGRFKDGVGFAPTSKTAIKFDDQESARRFADNSYGPETASCAYVITYGQAIR